jgi:hypothetical protein
MKLGVENGRSESSRISHESVLSTFPGSAGFSFKITFDVLVKSRVIATQQSMIFGGQDDIDWLTER